jgi:hypothetical protein
MLVIRTLLCVLWVNTLKYWKLLAKVEIVRLGWIDNNQELDASLAQKEE